ncbi:CxxxxCH/CxxCH domain-containing protein [candidate division KSB1 bacterium]
MKQFQAMFIFSLLLLFVVIGCSSLQESNPFEPEVVLSYSVNAKQVLDNNCISCHSGLEPSGQYDLSSLIGIFESGTDRVPNVIPGDASSLILQSIQAGAGMAEYIGSEENRTTLTSWIVDDRMGFSNMNAHPQVWVNPADDGFHGAYIKANSWDMGSCKSCHGQDYLGGVSGVSCVSCHEGTPESCNTCHGRSYTTHGAPPNDIAGNVDNTIRSVGAHAAHMSNSGFADPVECTDCHSVPAHYLDAGHIDSSPNAEVVFGTLAAAGDSLPELTSTLSCENVYCHGSFIAGNSDNIPQWTGIVGTGAECGSCHEIPPSKPTRNTGFRHLDFPVSNIYLCGLCHGSVIDNTYQFIDKTKHINGVVDF